MIESNAFGRRTILILSCTVLGVGILLLLGSDLMPVLDYQSKKREIVNLIPIGTDIDDAKRRLEAHSFSCNEKHFATNAKDRYWLEVSVGSDRTSICALILHSMGIRVYHHWIVVEANLDGEVQRIF